MRDQGGRRDRAVSGGAEASRSGVLARGRVASGGGDECSPPQARRVFVKAILRGKSEAHEEAPATRGGYRGQRTRGRFGLAQAHKSPPPAA